MRKLPTHSASAFQLILMTIQSYPIIFPRIVWLVLLSSLGHLVIPPLLQQNLAFGGVAIVAFIFLTWFLFTAILAKAQIALLGGKMAITDAFRLAKRRYLFMLGSNIIFFAIGALLMLVEFSLHLIFDLFNLHPIYLILSLMINIGVFIYLYFAIPEIALEHTSIFNAFEKSVHLVRKHWWHTFIVLAFFGLVILGFEALGILFTGQDRMVLFTAYHLVLQIIFYPLIVTATLLLRNDLKLRATTST